MLPPRILFRTITFSRLPTNYRTYSKHKNPFSKTWEVLSNDMPTLFGKPKPNIFSEHADIVIIGGGVIGSAVAYWLKSRAGEGLHVVVLEKDLTYTETRKTWHSGTLSQHFSLPENMYLAQYGAEFFRNIKENLGDTVDIEYSPTGHLVLASEKYAERLEQNVQIQKEFGVRNELLTVSEINKRYPWINTEDVHLGCRAIESEGSFNTWALLKGFMQKSQELGATYINGEVTGFEMEIQKDVLMEGIAPGSFERINRIIYKTEDNTEHLIKFAACILAAGNKSGEIAKLAKIGTKDGLLAIPIPIAQREQKVYAIKDKAKNTGLDTPIIIDTSGLWLKRNGLENNIFCGHVPLLSPEYKDLSEKDFVDQIIMPSLLNRIPSCKDAVINEHATEVYDYNVYDDTGFLGPHPYHNNLYLASGFGKQGYQHAPGLGRAISELIIDSHFTTTDLTRLTFDRVFTDQPLHEFNIY